ETAPASGKGLQRRPHRVAASVARGVARQATTRGARRTAAAESDGIRNHAPRSAGHVRTSQRLTAGRQYRRWLRQVERGPGYFVGAFAALPGRGRKSAAGRHSDSAAGEVQGTPHGTGNHHENEHV